MHDCYCCGIPVHSDFPYCDGCVEDENGDRCDPSITWHCDGRNDHSCDGTGCEEYEATIVPHPPVWPNYIDNPR